MSAHATTLGVELRRPGEALRAANGFDADAIPSLPRRSRHLIEVARAHHQRDEGHAAYALLDKAERTAPEPTKQLVCWGPYGDTWAKPGMHKARWKGSDGPTSAYETVEGTRRAGLKADREGPAVLSRSA